MDSGNGLEQSPHRVISLFCLGYRIRGQTSRILAALWYISDQGTLTARTEFYSHLSDAKIKAEALREAKIARILRKVRWRRSHQSANRRLSPSSCLS
ncbi:CHAT domain-containing protein [Laspinema sp. A4]|uniref:CHAT domain-containing protein n=1 Tax=Laspinema sp. D2d TaxID=2953686 RepID=UPI0021BA741E|nr:CHAT domain-containing protein [Laspinema sp. D2d]MCT7984879.1 CHAT domain-containing protein [Laspinema sp. D2d]